MKRFNIYWLFFGVIFILSGCGQTTEESLFTIFEDATKLEAKIPEYNQNLIELEGVESALFNQIISEGETSNKEIQDTITNAEQNCKNRKEILNSESTAMKASYEKSVESKKKIEKLEDKNTKEQGEKVQKLFNDRYYTFTLIEKNYTDTIAAEEELYALLKAEKQNLRDVEAIIAKINGLYEVNRNKQATFTELSTQLNNEKKLFYELLGIPMQEKTVEP